VINSERPKYGPETVVEEINSDLLEADFWAVWENWQNDLRIAREQTRIGTS
jgi:hypothetical protein